jgi:hypothetical protein
MPWVGFEPTIPAFERAKTIHALDCATTVIGHYLWVSLRNFAVQKQYASVYGSNLGKPRSGHYVRWWCHTTRTRAISECNSGGAGTTTPTTFTLKPDLSNLQNGITRTSHILDIPVSPTSVIDTGNYSWQAVDKRCLLWGLTLYLYFISFILFFQLFLLHFLLLVDKYAS